MRARRVSAVVAIFCVTVLAGANTSSAQGRPLPWRFVSERVIAPAEGSKGELGEIVSMAVADDGTIYAMQKSPATVLVFGPDGKFLRTIGREGDGPGELRSGMIGVKGNLLMVQDWSARRFNIFQTNGTFVKTVPSLCCQYSATLHVDSAGTAWVGGPIRGKESVYLRIDAKGKVLDTIPAPAFILSKTWTADARKSSKPSLHVVAVPGYPTESFLLRYDGSILMGRTDSMRFVVSRTGRDTVRIIEGPTRRTSVTVAEKAMLIQRTVEGLPTEALQEALRKVAKASDIPDRSMAWIAAFSDRAHRTWVLLPAAKDGTTRLGVFDANGKYLGEVPYPVVPGGRLFVMGRDRIAVVEESPDGLQQIRVSKLVIGS